MDDVLNDQRMAQQALPVLEKLYGIWPEHCGDALASVLAAFGRVFGRDAEAWADLVGELDHPDLQAALAYFRALGPYEKRLGQKLQPEEVAVETWVTAVQTAEVPAEPAIERKRQTLTLPPAKPLPRLIELPQEAYATAPYLPAVSAATRGQIATGRLLEELLVICPADRRESPHDWRQMLALDAVIGKMAAHATQQGLTSLDVYLPHPNPSPVGAVIVRSWMDQVRPKFPGLRLWFKFQEPVPVLLQPKPATARR